MGTMTTIAAWDLIGQEGTFRIKGGRATYEAVLYNEATARGDKVRLARLEATPEGIRQINRWVDADTPIEILEGPERRFSGPVIYLSIPTDDDRRVDSLNFTSLPVALRRPLGERSMFETIGKITGLGFTAGRVTVEGTTSLPPGRYGAAVDLSGGEMLQEGDLIVFGERPSLSGDRHRHPCLAGGSHRRGAMTVHVVSCLKAWYPEKVPGGAVAEADDDRPDRVVVDGEVLRCGSWEYRPRTWVTPGGRHGPYWSDAWLQVELPMENGACLSVLYNDRETVSLHLGVDEPGWRPLVETADALINSHRGCIGGPCTDLVCGSRLLNPPEEWTGSVAEVLAVWKRCGTKPVDLTQPGPRPTRPEPAKPKVSELDRRIAAGRTVTLEEYRRLTQ